MADFNFVDEINTIFDDSIDVITKSKNLSEKLNQSANQNYFMFKKQWKSSLVWEWWKRS